MKLLKNIFLPVFFVTLFFIQSSFVVQAETTQSTSISGPNQSTLFGGPVQSTSGTGCGVSGNLFQFCNPLNISTICGLIKQLLSLFLAIGTPIAVLFLVYAGFMFVIARGNATKLGVARTNLVHVVLGICIFLGAWLMGQVIANTINAISPGTVNTGNSCS